MRKVIELTDDQYSLLIGCFKCHIPFVVICAISGLPQGVIRHEYARWRLCCEIHNLCMPPKEPGWNEIHRSCSSKVFSY